MDGMHRIRHRLLGCAGLFALALAVAVPGAQAAGRWSGDIKDTVKEAFQVRPGGTLTVEVNQGAIHVKTRPGNRVLIEVERIAAAETREEAKGILKHHRLQFEQQGDNVTVESRVDDEDAGLWGRWRNHKRLDVRVYVYVPEQYNVEFSSGFGNVRVEGVTGTVEGSTGAGSIAIGDVRGVVEVSTGSGNVNVTGELERAEVETGAGNVKLRGLTGAVDVETGAGNIVAEITRQPTHDSSLESGAGNVTVYLGDAIGAYVDASAGMGSANCAYPLPVEGEWVSRSFEGEVNGGGPELRMRAGVGNVSLKKL